MLITSITLKGDYGISTASYVYDVYTKQDGAYYECSIIHKGKKNYRHRQDWNGKNTVELIKSIMDVIYSSHGITGDY